MMVTRPRRPMPEDFVEVAESLNRSSKRLMLHYKVGQSALFRWMAEAGLEFTRSAMSAPADLAECAVRMDISQLAAHYGKSKKRVYAWLSSLDLKAFKEFKPSPNRKPVPADFLALAPTMTKTELHAHYGKPSWTIIYRWLEETGVTAAPRPKSIPPKKGIFHIDKRTDGRRGMNFAKMRVTSLYDEAADVLRRERWSVHRCNERGLYDLKGKFWRAGNLVLTPDELLKRADRYRRRAA